MVQISACFDLFFEEKISNFSFRRDGDDLSFVVVDDIVVLGLPSLLNATAATECVVCAEPLRSDFNQNGSRRFLMRGRERSNDDGRTGLTVTWNDMMR